MAEYKRILISRIDSIGDVVLTLPLAIALKELHPNAEILFLGQEYTRPVIERCTGVDRFIDVKLIKKSNDLKVLQIDAFIHVFPNRRLASLAKQAGIPIRIGTSHRIYHWWTCNGRLDLGRKNSEMHEAQLNLKLGTPLGIKPDFSLDEIRAMPFFRKKTISEKVSALIDPAKINVILHPKSKGSAREWGLDNFSALVKLLPAETFKLFLSGTAADGQGLNDWIHKYPQATDLTGKLSLSELMDFISLSDALVAASTGPLHIASASGIHAIGIYAPMRPIHIGRWGPLGQKAIAFSLERACSDCRKSKDCHCIRDVTPEQIARYIKGIKK